jgi:L-ascorbate metabolism protein UlaG (beta-lactamase superfamily)
VTGRFDDRLTAPLPRLRDMVRILREGGFKPKDAERDAASVPRVSAPLPPLVAAQASLTWVGHATFLVRMGGLSILTDPVWADALPGRIRRLVPPGIAWQDLPRIDAVVVSHNHYDHQDGPTLKRLPRATPVFVGLGGGRWFRRRGFSDVVELDWWQSAERGGVTFSFVPVHHWSRRGLLDTNAALWGGWVLQGAGRTAFFAGDTGYGGRFKEVGQRHPGIEAALLPIGAYDPRWFMQNVHMDPDEAVQALSDLGARRLVAMHWGTFPLTREPILQPLERVRAAWQRTGRPRQELWDLAVGETRVWGEETVETGRAGRAVRTVL